MASPPPQHQPGALTLELLERRFAQIAGDRAHIGAAALQEALGLQSEYLARRILAQLDADGDGVVSREEFFDGVRGLVYGTDHDRLMFAFRLHDHDGDGYLSLVELERMIAIGLAEDGIEAQANQSTETLARALLDAADRDGDARISFAELELLVRERPELMREMARAEALWIAPNRDLLVGLSAPPAAPRRSRPVLRLVENHWIEAVIVIACVAANAAIFFATLLAAPDGKHTNGSMQFGRATGAIIGFNAGLILVPVMRRLLTRVRASWLGRVLPVDSAVAFHKSMGHALFVLMLAHVAAFTTSWLAGHPSTSFAGAIARLFFMTGRGLTGTLLLGISTVMWIAALRWIRRTRRFEIFYYTHLLYLPWLVLLIVHAPHALVWIGLPLLGLGVERLLRVARRGEHAHVLSIEPLRSGVTRVEIARPAGFSFAAADYVFVRIPAVARHEWHPFTISSAPERDSITLHVRSVGNWTSAVRALAEERSRQEQREPLAAYVDGPYGTPSAHIFRSRFAVLVGAGIGVTPFASVLESLVSRQEGDEGAALERAHFFWLNRDQRSFEWFHDLLVDIERRDSRGLLQLHLHMTEGRSGSTALGLEIAREVAHSRGLGDVATGLHVKTRMGDPDWRAELRTIAREHAPHDVDVYYCGPHGLGVKLRRVCAELGMPFREEKF